jgi:hypothetical protein
MKALGRWVVAALATTALVRGARADEVVALAETAPPVEIVTLETAASSPVAAVIRLEAADADAARAGATPAGVPGLSADRARVLLRSLTFPGWGQASAGHRTSATVFGLAELGVWASFTAFKIQSHLRQDTYERTARLAAGIDLSNRDEEYRRIVGSYISSEEYNLLVVHRDAANQFLVREDGPPDYEGYREYIEKNSVGGANAWSWDSEESLIRYQAQRRDAQRAGIRANSALAIAIVNRLLSAVHAARASTREPRAQSWQLEVLPGRGDDPTAVSVGVRARF